MPSDRYRRLWIRFRNLMYFTRAVFVRAPGTAFDNAVMRRQGFRDPTMPLVLLLLVGVIVLETEFGGISLHIFASEPPAVSSTSLLPKGVLVEDDAPIEHLILRPIPDEIDLLFGDRRCIASENISSKIKVRFLPLEKA
jgi:hypothetical protein